MLQALLLIDGMLVVGLSPACRNKMTYTLYRPNGLPCYRASESQGGVSHPGLPAATLCLRST
jgi:hypothetical protein